MRVVVLRLLAGFGLALGILGQSVPSRAATWIKKETLVEIGVDGTVVETHYRRLRIDTEADANDYQAYPVYLDENRSLASLEAHVVTLEGKRTKVKRKSQDDVEYSGPFELATSSSYHVVFFAPLTPGTEWEVHYQVVVRPYFPAGRLALGDAINTNEISVEIRGGGSQFRHSLSSVDNSFKVRQTDGGVVVSAVDIEAEDPLGWSPSDSRDEPYLRYSWSDEASWSQVSAWYNHLLSQVPRSSSAVRSQAQSLIGSKETAREKLESILEFMRKQVRYEAVEIGIGGYQPSAPDEVLARRWGDCKDKAILMIDMLEEAGIEAYPVLIRSGRGSRVDIDFPSPGHFNHLIVAVPENQVALTPTDPVAEGYLFLDPTQTRGSSAWLSPSDQGKNVVVVQGDQAQVVRTPNRHESELTQMTVTLDVDATGGATGSLELLVQGQRASWLMEEFAEAPELANDTANRSLKELTSITKLSLDSVAVSEQTVPVVLFEAGVEIANFVQSAGARRSLRLPSLHGAPDSVYLDDRTVPARVYGRRVHSVWRINLPAGWCPPAADEQRVENDAGDFFQRVSATSDQVLVERRTDIKQQWFEGKSLADLLEISVAERRGQKRRLRLDCQLTHGSKRFLPSTSPFVVG